ncbi:MAG: T9SS type B sorting domain-containing protein [Flavisolibacter sp.]
MRIFFLLTLILSNLLVHGQLCQGSLGDPIVNITFGSGANPGAPLSAATTNYQFVSVDCPNDGQYAVRNSTNNCYSTWHTLQSDHTGNAGGYFMLVNASFQPSAFYVDTVDLLCSNTLYEFAAWSINMMRTTFCGGGATILSNLSFSIEKTDGTVLQTYNTGDIPVNSVPTWTQYGFFFSAPSGVTRVVLRITNNAPGGCGNDLAIDDITFRPCGPKVDAMINGGGFTKDICEKTVEQVTLSATISSGFDDPFIQWQQSDNNGTTWNDIPGANSTTLQLDFNATTIPGTYSYRLSVSKRENSTVALCRINSRVLTVRINPLPVITITSNSPLCQNNTVNIQASGGAVYDWTGPNAWISNEATINIPNAQLNQSGKYYVVATTSAGCRLKDSVNLIINPSPVAVVSPDMATICEGQTVSLNSSGGDNYLWKPAAGLSSISIPNPVATPVDSINYSVIVSNSFSCYDTGFVQINVFKKPVANAGPDREMLRGQSIQLLGLVKGSSISYSWSPNHAIDNIQSPQPVVNPVVDTSYILTVASNVGCGTARDTVRVRVFKDIYVPTAFSPNNDGLNDRWKVLGLGFFKETEVTVYNRYGQVVFMSKNDQPWDGRLKGKDQPTGVYPYVIRIKDVNIILKGWVMIVR